MAAVKVAPVGQRKIDRLDEFARVRNINDNQITKESKLAIGTLGKSRKPDKDLSTRSADLILTTYPEINRHWFITGEGEMFGEPSKPTFKVYPLIDSTLAECGPSVGLSQAVVELENLPQVAIPGVPRDTEFFIQASGYSMINRENPDLTIPPGAMVGLSKVNAGIIRWGEAYAIVTADGVMIKRLLPDADNKDNIRCVSYNSADFPEFTISRDEIVEIDRITCVVPVMVR